MSDRRVTFRRGQLYQEEEGEVEAKSKEVSQGCLPGEVKSVLRQNYVLGQPDKKADSYFVC